MSHNVKCFFQIVIYIGGLALLFLCVSWLLGAHLTEGERMDRAAMWNPEYAKAKAQREQAEELRRSNDLREQEMEERRLERRRQQSNQQLEK